MSRKRIDSEEASLRDDREHETPESQRGDEDNSTDNPPRQRGDQDTRRPQRQGGDESGSDRSSAVSASRFVRAVATFLPRRNEVYWRDEGRCTYVDAWGERCCETHYLELHHLRPFAKNGASEAENLTLRCSAHNALAGEHDFGRQRVNERRDAKRHESHARQTLVDDDLS